MNGNLEASLLELVCRPDTWLKWDSRFRVATAVLTAKHLGIPVGSSINVTIPVLCLPYEWKVAAMEVEVLP
jgi:hypothetical protein